MHKKVFLTSTDTAIGFISQSQEALDKAKQRVEGKKYIIALTSLKYIKKRVPKKYKNLVRRAKKTTFILSRNYSFRVIQDKKHKLLINRLGWIYTTSANRSGEEFNLDYAIENSDVIVYNLRENSPSTILQLGVKKFRKVR